MEEIDSLPFVTITILSGLRLYDKNTLLYTHSITVFFYCGFVFCVIDFHFHIYLNLILLSLLLKLNLTSELQKSTTSC